MKWFRLYSEVLNDSKVQSLRPELFKFWVNLLCLAGSREERGQLPDVGGVAYALRIRKDHAARFMDELVRAGLVDQSKDSRLEIHNWEARQHATDSSTMRVRKYRQRLYDLGETANGYAEHRQTVLSRDGNTCVYCPSTVNLVLDHLVPLSRGGDSKIDNLVTACKACNSGKSGRFPEEAGYAFRNTRTIEQYATARARLGIRDGDTLPSETVTLAPSDTDTEEERQTDSSRAPAPTTRAREAAAVSSGPVGEVPQTEGINPGLRDTITTVRRLKGEDAARQIWSQRARIGRELGGRWDCYAAAMRKAERVANRPGAKPIEDLCAFAMSLARKYIAEGIPPEPITVEPVASKSSDGYEQPPYYECSPERRAELAAQYAQGDRPKLSPAERRRQSFKRFGIITDDAYPPLPTRTGTHP